MRLTEKQFIEQLEKKYPKEPFRILEYKGTSKPGRYWCGFCKKEYSLCRMGKLLAVEKKHFCRQCFLSDKTEKVMDIIARRDDLEFVQISYKENLHKPSIVYRCLLCGQITEKPHIEFLKYPTCIHCGKNAKRRNKDTIGSYLPKGMSLIGEYEHQYKKTLFRHSCGFIFKARPKDVISGHTYCPKCSSKMSKGERRIMEYLSREDILFEREFSPEWARPRRYDFYLPEHNIIIEYNGEQHYREVPYFRTTLLEQQKIDLCKKNIAEEHDITYIVISYLDYENIETILAQRLRREHLTYQYGEDIV